MTDGTSGVIEKLALIVAALSEHGELTPAELSEETGIPRSTVYRILSGMCLEDLATATDRSSYTLSLRWVLLADAARRGLTEWQPYVDVLAPISAATGLTSFFTVLQGRETICTAWVQGTGMDAMILRPGRTLPLTAGAAGRAALAALPVADFEDLLRHAPFTVYNHHTLATAEDLVRDRQQAIERGYALSEEDVTLGVGAVGVSITADAPRGAIGSLSVAGPIGEISSQHELLARTIRDEISRAAVTAGTASTAGDVR